ncbi:hypothetical protein A8B79_15700 [Balneola sp. EhC07]|uniref:DUF6443 domain-containing protein n=1 Tax=Balneola sp. EhC07 TaxID=1849360 RepID=UPI0007F490A5|nr:DUF6443 domain-containing protein [Balneola sp. EhC07]OAN63257.1 hypothetical protein A8B79_15700 [Balneola sp. EhC07]
MNLRKLKKLVIICLFIAINYEVTELSANNNTPPSIITVTGPASGSTCYNGQSCTIEWVVDSGFSYQQPDKFRIEYKKTTDQNWTLINEDYIANFMPLDGTDYQYSYWSPPNIQEGTYEIRVSKYEEWCQDNSCSYFEAGYDIGDQFNIVTPPYIDNTGPASGTYNLGGVLPFSWTSNVNSVTPVLINIDSGYEDPITSCGTGSSGSCSWNIPTSQAEGNYRIEFQASSVTENSAHFRIEPKRIIMQSPSGGEFFEFGAKPNIKWNKNFEGGNVDIKLRAIVNGVPAYVPIASGVSGSSYEWTVTSPLNTSLNYKIYIEDSNNSSLNDLSTDYFKVIDPETNIQNINFAQSKSIRIPITNISGISSLQVGNKEISKTIGYVDGTGKMQQSIALESSPSQNDVITPHSYNEIGQETIKYQPFTMQTKFGELHTSVFEDQEDFYTNGTGGVEPNTAPYAKSVTEKSPLLVLKEQGAPGPTYQPGAGKTVLTKSDANTSTDDVIYWRVNSAGNPEANGYYPEAELGKNTTTDENGKTSYTYTDREGREVLKVGYQNSFTPVKTYYVYDKYGNLRFIIPPEAVVDIGSNNTIELTPTHTIRTTWLTEMRYDGFNRVVWKKIPEAEPVYTVYDKLGRVALTQDGNMRTANEWFFTKYDIRGRAIMTGVYTEIDEDRDSREEMQGYLNTWNGATWENRTSANFETQHGYTFNRTFPVSLQNSMIWSVTYYDDYDFNNNGTPDETFEANTEFTALTGNNRSPHEVDLMRTDGMVTGSKTRILSYPTVIETNTNTEYDNHNYDNSEVYYIGNGGSSITLKPGFKTKPGQNVVIGNENSIPVSSFDEYNKGSWLEGVTFADEYGRTIYSKSTNHLGGTNKTWILYHFDGEVERTKQVHTGNSVTTTVRNRFEYDHGGRLLAQYQQNNSDAEVKIVENDYNELSQITTKKLHYLGGGDFLQTLNYSYHQRGWLKSVNDPDNLESDLFGYSLSYDQTPSGGQTSPLYNGNIIGMNWATKWNGTTTKRGQYSYAYDGLNQLTNAYFRAKVGSSWTSTGEGNYETRYHYDRNGNITELRRAGGTQAMMADWMYYDYNGNKVVGINDIDGSQSYGFKDNGSYNTSGEYLYDVNGNMTRDYNKGITDIRYNRLNLPEVITFDSGNQIVYLYDASGAKLSKKTYVNSSLGVRAEYSGGFVYEDQSLSFFGFGEGRVRNAASGLQYEYDYKDHLGNVRATFRNNSGSPLLLQADDYYPFGLKMSDFSYLNSGSDENKFTYNGKEFGGELGLNWYHYGARFYDPTVGRWLSVDPLGQFHSSYLVNANNPLIYKDEDGEWVHIVVGGLVGTAVGVYNVAKEKGLNPKNWDMKDVGRIMVSTGTGALIAAVPSSAGWVAGGIQAGSISASGNLADQVLRSNNLSEISYSEVALSGITGSLAFAGSYRASSWLNSKANAVYWGRGNVNSKYYKFGGVTPRWVRAARSQDYPGFGASITNSVTDFLNTLSNNVLGNWMNNLFEDNAEVIVEGLQCSCVVAEGSNE